MCADRPEIQLLSSFFKVHISSETRDLGLERCVLDVR